MGRTGEISPSDHILASIVAALTFMTLPMVPPLAHRFGPVFLRKAILVSLSVSVAAVAIFAAVGQNPFDEMHPQRLFTHHVHNITSGEWWMNLGSADPSSRTQFQQLADGLHAELGVPGESAQVKEMNEYNADFDILYPVSEFITPWKFRLPTPPVDSASVQRWTGEGINSFIVKAVKDELDLEAGTRSVTLEINHPDIIWSVIAFDAEILEWDLPVKPPSGYRRHHIKEVSRYGKDVWSLRLLLRLPPHQVEAAQRLATGKQSKVASPDFSHLIRVDPSNSTDTVFSQYEAANAPWRLRIDFSGLWGEGMYPMAERSTKREVLEDQAVRNLRQMDQWLIKEHPEVDAMLLSVVAGVAIA